MLGSGFMEEERIDEEEMFLKALKLVGANMSKLRRWRNNNPMCDECDKLAEVVAIGINAPIWECSECGKEIVDDQCKG